MEVKNIRSCLQRTTMSAVVSALISCNIAWGLFMILSGNQLPQPEPPLLQGLGGLICVFFGVMTVPLARGVNWARKICLTIAFFYIADFLIMVHALNISLFFGDGNIFKQCLWREYGMLIGLQILLSALLWKPFAPRRIAT